MRAPLEIPYRGGVTTEPEPQARPRFAHRAPPQGLAAVAGAVVGKRDGPSHLWVLAVSLLFAIVSITGFVSYCSADSDLSRPPEQEQVTDPGGG